MSDEFKNTPVSSSQSAFDLHDLNVAEGYDFPGD